jgi:hypothetical protein
VPHPDESRITILPSPVKKNVDEVQSPSWIQNAIHFWQNRGFYGWNLCLRVGLTGPIWIALAFIAPAIFARLRTIEDPNLVSFLLSVLANLLCWLLQRLIQYYIATFWLQL